MNTEMTEQAGAWSLEFRASKVFDWLPLLILPYAAFSFRGLLPSWIFTWVIAFAIFLGCKWLMWRRARRNGKSGGLLSSLRFFLLWPGMDAESLLWPAGVRDVSAATWLRGGTRTALGTACLWIAARSSVNSDSLWFGWLGMFGLILLLHFGVFELLGAAWRTAGVEAKPIMRAPLRATSLGDFWGKRWNTAFNTLAYDLAFRPLARRWGRAAAMLATFAISGLVHELVISVPARGCYGLPTAYFLFQGVAVLAERSKFGRRIGLGRGLRGRLFTLLCTAGPAFWLFHPPFVRNVILPMLRVLGSN